MKKAIIYIPNKNPMQSGLAKNDKWILEFKTKQSGIAQLVEQAAVNRWVVGSSPTAGAIHTNEEKICLWILYIAEHLPAY